MTSYRPNLSRLESYLRAEPGAALAPPLPALALMAAATALGRPEVLQSVVPLAITSGGSPDLLREVARQTYLFAGYPRAINALGILAEATGELDSPLDLDADRNRHDLWLARGEALCRQVYGETYPRLLDTLARRDDRLGRWMVVEGYGKVLADPLLGPRERELTAIAALAVLDVPPQLRAHLRGARLVGANEHQIDRVLEIAGTLLPEALAGNLALARSLREAG